MNYLCDKIVKMQSILNEKSATSEKLAKFLYGKEECAASINRACYACIQQVMYLLLLDFSTERDFTNHCQDKARAMGIGIHEFYIQEMASNIDDTAESENFANDMDTLKKLRVRADYKHELMDKYNADDALDYMENILETLQNL